MYARSASSLSAGTRQKRGRATTTWASLGLGGFTRLSAGCVSAPLGFEIGAGRWRDRSSGAGWLRDRRSAPCLVASRWELRETMVLVGKGTFLGCCCNRRMTKLVFIKVNYASLVAMKNSSHTDVRAKILQLPIRSAQSFCCENLRPSHCENLRPSHCRSSTKLQNIKICCDGCGRSRNTRLLRVFTQTFTHLYYSTLPVYSKQV